MRFKGLDEGFLRENAPLFVDEFSRVAEVPREKVKIELLPVIPITATPRSLAKGVGVKGRRGQASKLPS